MYLIIIIRSVFKGAYHHKCFGTRGLPEISSLILSLRISGLQCSLAQKTTGLDQDPMRLEKAAFTLHQASREALMLRCHLLLPYPESPVLNTTSPAVEDG